MRRTRTLVTGASGFIGSRLVRYLLSQGEQVKALVRPGANLRALAGLDQVELAYGDIMVASTVYRALAGCSRLYHVATNHRWWDPEPQNILGPAVQGTRAVLAAAQRRGVDKVVVTSSVSALGITDRPEPMDETHQLVTRDADLYALAKRDAEQVALKYAALGLPVVVVEPAVALGPGDWRPTPSGQLVLSYLKSRWRVPVFPGGFSVVEVDDVCRGHWLAMQHGRAGERYILGGDNLAYHEFWSLLWAITTLRRPGPRLGAGLLRAACWLSTLKSQLAESEPCCTVGRAKQLSGYAWVTSGKAEKELGYTHRAAREAVQRSVRFFADRSFVPEALATRLRHELAHVT